MSQLWLVPADEPSYQQTLSQPRDLTPAPDKPNEFPNQARVWGVRTDLEKGSWERNRRNLKLMSPGDPLLIYRNSESHYVAAGRIGGPLWHTTWVRDELWNGGPALDIFHIDDWTPVSLNPNTVNRALDYKLNFVPQGLWRVADNRPIGELLRRISFG